MVVLVDTFLAWLLVRNYSRHSVETRRHQLRHFVAWAATRGVLRPAEVTRAVVERYQRALYHQRKANGQPLSFRWQHSQLMGLRAFFKWLVRHRHVLYNPTADLEMPRLESRLPKDVLSVAEAEQILAQATSADPVTRRDRAILETLYSTGMRRGELAGLSVYDLDWERGTVRIRQGKGGKERIVPIGRRALAWLDTYLQEGRPHLALWPEEPALFLTTQGDPLRPKGLSKLVRGYILRAGVGKEGACHLWRHTMATLMLENGADVRYIQEMLGHSKLESTQIYTRVSIGQLKAVHTATHPAHWPAGGRGEGDNSEEVLG
jgi:integrase/recombinase XerD